MINAEFRQLAEEYGMKCDQGVAYGIVEGYAATFLDGTGCSRIMLTTRFDSAAQKDALMTIVDAKDLKGEYFIRKLQIAKKVIHVAFRSAPDTVERIRAFIAWFFPLLEEYGASKADICTQCLESMDEEDAHWVLRDGAVAFRMHHTCAEALKQTVSGSNKSYRADPNGSVGKGILGALLGALVGALLWMLLQAINFFAPIAGMAIGWLVLFFYGRLKGKSGKWRLPILILAGALGTAVGVVLAEIPTLVQTDGLRAFSVFFENFTTIDQYQSGIFSNLSMGLLFFALGLFVSIKSESRRTTDMVVTDLE